MSTYTIVSELGRGGMGAVFRATQVELGRDVALKVLLPAFVQSSDHAARFQREIKVLMQLEHPNIVRIFDCGELNGQLYYAMELLEAEPIEKRVLRDGAMDWRQALKLGRQAADALAYCHARGHVHRDVKLLNLMVDARDHVTLMDFGLTRREGGTVMTQAGKLVGTPRYLAPEVIEGADAGPTADVYALGIAIHEMLTAAHALTAGSMRDLLLQIVQSGPPPIETQVKDLPDGLVTLIHQMVAHEPAKRPTARKIVERIDAITGRQAGMSDSAVELLGLDALAKAASDGQSTTGTEAAPEPGGGGGGPEAATARWPSAPGAAPAAAGAGAGGGTPSTRTGSMRAMQGARPTNPRGTSPVTLQPQTPPPITPASAAGGSRRLTAARGLPVPEAGARTSTARGTVGMAGQEASHPTAPRGTAALGQATPTGARGIKTVAVPMLKDDNARRRLMALGAGGGVALAALVLAVAWLRPGGPPGQDQASANATPAFTGPAPRLDVKIYPPRHLRLVLSALPSPDAAWRYRVSEGPREVASGRVDAQQGVPVLACGEPGHRYTASILGGEHGPEIARAEAAMPSALPLGIALAPSERHVGLLLYSAEPVRVSITIERESNRSVAFSQRTTGPLHLYQIIPGLEPDTVYRLAIRALDTDRYVTRGLVGFRTRKEGFIAGLRAEIPHLRDPPPEDFVAAQKLDDGNEVMLVPSLLAIMRDPAFHDEIQLSRLAMAVSDVHDPRALRTLSDLLVQIVDPESKMWLAEAVGKMFEPAGFDVVAREGKRIRPVPYYTSVLALALVRCDARRAAQWAREVFDQPDGRAEIERLAACQVVRLTQERAMARDVAKLATSRPQEPITTWAARVLGHLGGPEGEAGLEELADAPDPAADGENARLSVLGNLARIGGTAQVARVTAALEPSRTPLVRFAATQALGEIGGDQATARLLDLLADPDPHVRRAAAWGLGRLSVSRAVGPLIERLSDPAMSLGRVPRALGMIGDRRGLDALLAMVGRTAAPASPPGGGARGGEDEGTPAGEGPLDTATVDRAEALWALGLAREMRALRPMLDALSDAHGYVRARAAEALGLLGSREAQGPLERAAQRRHESRAVLEVIKSASEWIATGHRPEGRLVVVDSATPVERSGIVLLPGEPLRVKPVGVWAEAPGAHLLGPSGGAPVVDRNARLALILDVGIADPIDLRDNPAFLTQFASGELALWGNGPPRPDAVGFLSVWVDTPAPVETL